MDLTDIIFFASAMLLGWALTYLYFEWRYPPEQRECAHHHYPRHGEAENLIVDAGPHGHIGVKQPEVVWVRRCRSCGKAWAKP